jgi:hypothetical protein
MALDTATGSAQQADASPNVDAVAAEFARLSTRWPLAPRRDPGRRLVRSTGRANGRRGRGGGLAASGGHEKPIEAVVSRYLRSTPQSVVLERSETGKPKLAGGPFAVNLAHSGNTALVVVTQEGEAGIDLERLRPTRGLGPGRPCP